MVLTIVVCTRDRPQQLGRCLKALQAQSFAESELLVVASAPTTDLEAKTATAVNARYVAADRPGLDVARNLAVLAAAGDVIAFVDDDVIAAPGWATAVAAAFDDDTVSLMTGRVLPLELVTPAQRNFEARFSFDRGERPGRFTRHHPFPWFPLHPYHLGAGCNMAFRRQVFTEVGLFDEALDAGTATGGSGDLDMFRRILQAGHTAVYNPDALVYHEHRREAAASRRQFWNYGKSFSAHLYKVWRQEPDLAGQAPRLARQQAMFLAGQLVRAAQRQPGSVPFHLTMLEAVGNLVGPWSYWYAQRQLRSAHGR